jgi:hypothetical protein
MSVGLMVYILLSARKTEAKKTKKKENRGESEREEKKE